MNRWVTVGLAVVLGASASGALQAQAVPKVKVQVGTQPQVKGAPKAVAVPKAAEAPKAAQPDTLEAINAEFEKALKAIESTRLQRLDQLAQRQPPEQAAATQEFLLRTAIQSGLFVEAEPIAQRLLTQKGLSATNGWLAVFVDMMAKAKRGAYEDSLNTLVAMVHHNEEVKAANPEQRLNALIPETQRISLIDAYYQVLVQADQFATARKAMALLKEKTESTIIRQMVTSRLHQLDLVGKAAPPIVGTCIDGKAVDLANLKGDVVVVAFWATWSLPSAEEVEFFEEVYHKNKARGLKVIAVNVDAMQEGGVDVATVLPAVRRFTLAKNVDWPVLMNQAGEANYAAAYGVSEVPASVVIDRQGKVAHLDLHRANLEKKVLEELAR